MATWTNIQTSRLEPGKPIRSIDGLALRDNPIAIAEGASGAPKIAGQNSWAVDTGGLRNGSVTTAKINNSAVTTGKIANSAVTTGKIANNAVTSAKLRESNAERDWVLGRTSKATAGAVGTYSLVHRNDQGSTNWNGTTAGSKLTPISIIKVGSAGDLDFYDSSRTLSGTWRCMGESFTAGATTRATLALRIS